MTYRNWNVHITKRCCYLFGIAAIIFRLHMWWRWYWIMLLCVCITTHINSMRFLPINWRCCILSCGCRGLYFFFIEEVIIWMLEKNLNSILFLNSRILHLPAKPVADWYGFGRCTNILSRIWSMFSAVLSECCPACLNTRYF